MMRNKNVLLLVFLLTSTLAIAQRNTRSPYSMFGIGELENRNYGLHSGIGGAEIGTRTSNYLNSSNPAGISIDSLYFLFDIYAGAKMSNFYSGNNNANIYSMNLKKLAVGFRPAKIWATSIGLKPYSNVEYEIVKNTPVEGNVGEGFKTEFKGDGGLAQIYMANSIKVYKGLNLGVRASYVFGDVDTYESMNLQYIKQNSHSRKLFLDFGLQYQKKVSEDFDYTIGAVYGYENKFKYVNTQYLSLTNIEENISPTYEYTPQYFGIGLSMKRNKGHRSLFYAIDYTFQNWAAVKSPAARVYYDNSHKINGGIKYIPNYRTARKYFQAVEYQLGGYYSLNHINIAGNQMQDFGLTFGARLPLKNRTSAMVSVDLGWRGGKGMIKEKYALFTVGVSLAEVWFMKWAYD